MPSPNLAAKTATRLFLATLVALVVTFLLGSLAFGAAIYSQDIPIDQLSSIGLDYAQRQVLRLGLMVNNLLLFAGGGRGSPVVRLSPPLGRSGTARPRAPPR